MAAARTNHWFKPTIVMLLLALAAGAVLWSGVARWWYKDVGRAQWHHELAAVPDEHIVEYVRNAIAHENDPTPLVELLASQRPDVVRAAHELLMETLDRWQLAPARRTSPRVAHLAQQLADHCHLWGPAALDAASQLAARILLWPVDGRLIDEERLILECETLLRASAECRQEKRDGLPRVRRPGKEVSPPIDPASPGELAEGEDQQVPPAPLEQQFVLPGGNLPVHTMHIGTEPTTPDTSPIRR
jgi:hypothetical protein